MVNDASGPVPSVPARRQAQLIGWADEADFEFKHAALDRLINDKRAREIYRRRWNC